MKKRIITLVLSALAAVLLVGVGFASWVVSQGDANEQTGNILVETVKDERLAVTVTPDGKSFQFGAPATGATEGWLHEDGENAIPENLVVTFKVEVTRPTAFVLDANSQPEGLELTNTLKDKIIKPAQGENPAVEENYPSALFDRDAVVFGANEVKEGEEVVLASSYNDSTWSMSEDHKTATTHVKVSLKWGTLFGSENPYDYFNDGVKKVGDAIGSTAATAAGLADIDEDSTWGDLAVKALEAILKYNNYQFQLKIEVKMQ